MTPSTVAEIVRQFRSGISQTAIAMKYGIEPSRVTEIVGPAMEATEQQAQAAIARLDALGIIDPSPQGNIFRYLEKVDRLGAS